MDQRKGRGVLYACLNQQLFVFRPTLPVQIKGMIGKQAESVHDLHTLLLMKTIMTMSLILLMLVNQTDFFLSDGKRKAPDKDGRL